MASPLAASKMLPMMERAISGEKTTGACCVWHAAGAEAAEGAAGGFVADGDGVFEQAGGAGVGVPVVALHLAVLVVGDGLGGEAAIAAAVFADEAARVHHDLVRGGGVEVAAAGVLDAGVEGHGGGFDFARDADAVGGRLLVDVVEVEVLGGGSMLAEGVGFGQAGEGIFAGDAGEGDGAGDEAVDGFGRKVGGRGAGGAVGFAGGDEDAQADGAGAGFLEGFDLAEADAGVELVALVEDGFGVGGAGLQGAGEHVGGELLQIGGGDGFSRHVVPRGARRCGGRLFDFAAQPRLA